MKKADLRTGMFGVFNNDFEDDTQVFVVVNDHLVYKDGKCDPINETWLTTGLSDDLTFKDGEQKITHLFEASCFNEVTNKLVNPIWERYPEETPKDNSEDKSEVANCFAELNKLYTEMRNDGLNREQAEGIFKSAMSAAILDKLLGGMKK